MSRNSCFFCFLFLSLLCFSFLIPHARADGLPAVSAKCAVVLDMETGQVLYNKNMSIKAFPASLTKILTTIIALEEGDINDIVKVSRRAAYQEGSSIYLQEGEEIKLEDLLYGVMLSSGNDASVAVAEHISGSIDEFALLMNEKAKEIGALNSNFKNPNGLPDPDHYSTAYDLAVIMRYAMKNKIFRTISGTKNRTISWAGNDWGRGLRNHNKLLWLYDDITGGKTGFTKAAGRCLAASAERNGREVIAVVL
ncbi:MAG: D-alanyl-D-alanine carboxypeptidase, partial [Halanaerobiaceae bacterium]|nr:D-alanyl-D-alanine carboxypeptidase [Halanaerobiaceae bacterium]